MSSHTDTLKHNPFDIYFKNIVFSNICFTLKKKNNPRRFCIKFALWARLLSILPQTYSKMVLHRQMFLFVLLNAGSKQTTWVQCMTIRFWLKTENLISSNKHVIGGVKNDHKVVVGISKVRQRYDS